MIGTLICSVQAVKVTEFLTHRRERWLPGTAAPARTSSSSNGRNGASGSRWRFRDSRDSDLSTRPTGLCFTRVEFDDGMIGGGPFWVFERRAREFPGTTSGKEVEIEEQRSRAP